MTAKNYGILTAIVLVIIGLGIWTVFGFQMFGLDVKPAIQDLKLGLDIEGGVVVVYEVKSEATGADLRTTMEQTRLILSQRINALGLTEPNVYIEGTNRIRIELPGVQDAQEALRVIGTTALLEFAQVKDGQGVMPGDSFDETKMTLVFSGERVKDAKAVMNEYNQPSVSLKLDSEGATIFQKVTSESINFTNGFTGSKNGQVAILLDGKVISAPSVGVVINDGSALITGSFEAEEAQELALLIRGGALPAKLEEVKTSAIGPTLGRDALNSSLLAAKIGLLLVVIYMVFFYRFPGVVASVSLVFYSVIVVLLLIGLKATLTLPGIAGIVLTLGMAVDANVIIFERVKEEIKEGKSIKASLVHGFNKAMATILDSNFTTLIAAVILYFLGEGAIKGFAITLMIGIITSMFTAIVVSRLILMQFTGSKSFSNKKFYGIRG